MMSLRKFNGLRVQDKASMSVEAFLTWIPLLLCLMLGLAWIHSLGQLLVLDQAFQKTTRSLCHGAYPLVELQALDLDPTGLLYQEILILAARQGLAHHLEEDLLLEGIKWEEASLESKEEGQLLTLKLRYYPGKVKQGLSSLLPDKLAFELVAQEVPWLTGRHLWPDRGKEGPLMRPEIESWVYVTRWGECYHQGDCRYLAQSRMPMVLEEAVLRYRPCRICRPVAEERDLIHNFHKDK